MLTDRICIIGRGRWGSSLLAALRLQGHAPFVVAGRAALNRSKLKQTGSRAISPAWMHADVFWLCVPDNQIETAARQLVKGLAAAGLEMAGRTVLHSSGVHSCRILRVAGKMGAQIGSVHPLMTFPSRRPVPIRGIPFAVEARQRLRKKLFHLVKALGGEPFNVSSQRKASYHVAAVMASPLLVSLATAAQALAVEAGLSRREADRLLQPIMKATLNNFFLKGGGRSFSGPLARGDVDTISLHLQALQAHPSVCRIYTSLCLYALESLPVSCKTRLQKLLNTQGKTARSRLATSSRPRRNRQS